MTRRPALCLFTLCVAQAGAWHRATVEELEAQAERRQMQGDVSGAAAQQQWVVTLREAAAEASPEDSGAHHALAVALQRMGALHGALGASTRAHGAWERSHAIASSWASREPQSTRWRAALAHAHTGRGNALRRLGWPDLALDDHRASLTLYRSLASAEPEDTEWRRCLAIALEGMALARAAEDWRQASEEMALAVEQRRALALASPGDVRLQADLALALIHRAEMHARRGEPGPAAAACEEAAALAHGLIVSEPAGAEWRTLRASALTAGAEALRQLGRLSAARRCVEGALHEARWLAARDGGNALLGAFVPALEEMLAEIASAEAAR